MLWAEQNQYRGIIFDMDANGIVDYVNKKQTGIGWEAKAILADIIDHHILQGSTISYV